MRLSIILSKKLIIAYLLMFGLFRPGCFSDLSTTVGGFWTILNNIYLFWGIADYIIILFLSIAYIDNIPFVVIPIFLLRTYLVIRDYTLSVPVRSDLQALGMHLSIILCVCLFEMMDSEYELMTGISNILGIYIIVNFITILIFREGFYINTRGWGWNYFLGFKNAHVYYYLPYIMTSALSDYLSSGYLKNKSLLMYGIIFVSTILSNTSTSIVIMLIIVVSMLAVKMDLIHFKFSVSKMLCASLGLSVCIIFFKIQNLFSNIITGILRRDLTFNKRISIWQSAIHGIIRHPLCGNGSVDVFSVNNVIGDMGHAHNMFLDLLYQGGIITLALFIVTLVAVSHRLTNYYQYKITQYMMVVLAGYFILFLMESNRTNASFYLLLGILWNIPELFHRSYPILNSGEALCE